MNLYDAYMSPRDRATCAPEDLAVLAEVTSEARSGLPPMRPAPTPTPPTDGCGCNGGCGGGACGENYPSLAMVYAPKQCFRMLYEPERALARGTLFAELDKPLEGGRR